MSAPIHYYMCALLIFHTTCVSLHESPIEYFRGHLRPDDAPREWPCPVATEIEPCVCTTTTTAGGLTTLQMDCSSIGGEEELQNVFQQIFPFNYFDLLTIKQDQMTSNLTQLTDGVFNGCYFDTIIITGTLIRSIGDNVFADSYNNLSTLNLNLNEISLFPFESLANFNTLQTLNLDGNKIPTLPKITSNSLRTVSFSSNYGIDLGTSIDIFGSVPSLKKVTMQFCGLTDLHDVFSSGLDLLEDIIVSNNDLTALPVNTFAFGGKGAHTFVDFSHNKINSVEAGFVTGLLAEGHVIGDGNSLNYIFKDQWEDIFRDVGAGGYVGLADNELLCGCEEMWILNNSNYTSTLSVGTTCTDNSVLKELNIDIFTKHCPTTETSCYQ